MDLVRRHFTAVVGITGRFPTPRLVRPRTEGQPRQCRTMLQAQSVTTVPIGVGGATLKNTSGLYAPEKWCPYSDTKGGKPLF